MVVGIIDDGINLKYIEHPVTQINLTDGRVFEQSISHATVCAKIIEKHGDVSEFIDVKILDNDDYGTVNILIDALNILRQYDVDIINISNGSDFFSFGGNVYAALYQAIMWHINHGTIVMCAQSNSGYRTIPALYNNVISVEQIRPIYNIRHSIYRRSALYTNGRKIFLVNHKIFISQNTNSFACAAATALKTKHSAFPLSKALNIAIFFYRKAQTLFEKREPKCIVLKNTKSFIIAFKLPKYDDNIFVKILEIYNKFLAEGYRAAIITSKMIPYHDYIFTFYSNKMLKNYIREGHEDIYIILIYGNKYRICNCDITATMIDDHFFTLDFVDSESKDVLLNDLCTELFKYILG